MPSNALTSGAEIRRRAAAGDPQLLREVFDAFRGDLLAYLRRRCGDATDAEDAVQDVFVVASRALADFRGEATLRTWLFRLAGSACTRLRRGRKHDARIHDDLAEATALPASAGAAFSVALQPLEAKVQIEERIEARLVPLQAALLALSPTDRAVLLLRDGEGLSAAEVAAELHLTESAVKSRLHRARRAVRERLE